ncbi:MAG TPA: acetate kinase [bacterium]|nr:acetate kinase [bacterium]
MSVLLLNAGSTSLKYQVLSDDGAVLKKGGSGRVKDFEQAFDQIIEELRFIDEITVVGHRIVHGGDRYHRPIVIDQEVVDYLENITTLAPLHLPFNILGVHLAKEHWPNLPQIALFDTAFFADLPKVAKMYALPQKTAEENHWHRFGFHGMSHEFLTQAAAENLNKKVEQVNLIICHLGGGSSVSAIKLGQAVDISLGWSPTAGLPMMTRCGDIDPGLLLEIIDKTPGGTSEEKIKAVRHLLNKESGLAGISGYDDFLDILAARKRGEAAAIEAFDYFVYRIISFVGAYWAVLDGQVDGIVLSGGIGFGSLDLQAAISEKLTSWCSAPVLPLETNEELAMLRQIKRLGY